MDKKELKEKLRQYIDDSENETALNMLHEAFVEYTKTDSKDILDELTPEQLEKLNESLQQAQDGKTISHEEALRRISAWRTK